MKLEFRRSWGWTNHPQGGDWSRGDDMPDGVRLPDGREIFFPEGYVNYAQIGRGGYPTPTAAGYFLFGEGDEVKAKHRTGGDDPSRSCGRRWSRLSLIVPRGAVLLYACEGCRQGDSRYPCMSGKPVMHEMAGKYCNDCRAVRQADLKDMEEEEACRRKLLQKWEEARARREE